MHGLQVAGGPVGERVDAELADLAAARFVERMWDGDHTLWQDDPTEVADRLGWLHSPAQMAERVGALEAFADGVAGAGLTHAVLLGMGGSSLFPEVAARTFGDGAAGLDVAVLDSTDPAAIRRIEAGVPLERTLFVAASKSGTTIETRSHLAYFWERVGRPEQFAVITDPGSPLASLGRERRFRAVFENRADIGGRYSALSSFGLVPAALVGASLEELLGRALTELEACRRPAAENPGVRLGALVGAAARVGRDKLTLHTSAQVPGLGAWIEQLVAESTGKAGTGVVPVSGEGLRHPRDYAADRLFAILGEVPEPGAPEPGAYLEAGHPVAHGTCDDPYDLGREVVRWEVATATIGRILGVNPFDQPDVAAAKEATARVLDGSLPEIERRSPAGALEAVGPGDYLAVQAFVDPGSETAAALRRATDELGRRLGVASTFGVGPRYLHSTGQLHKGGPRSGVFLQVVGDDTEDSEIPGAGYGFSRLKWAQAAGDLQALRDRGLRAARVEIDALIDAASGATAWPATRAGPT